MLRSGIALLATSCIEYLQGTTYEKPHCAINVLYVVFCAFVINCANQEWISLKLHKFPSFTEILNSKESGIAGEKLVRPARASRVSFWPATLVAAACWSSFLCSVNLILPLLPFYYYNQWLFDVSSSTLVLLKNYFLCFSGEGLHI